MPFLIVRKRAFLYTHKAKIRDIHLLPFIRMQRSQLNFSCSYLFVTTNKLLYKRRHQKFHLNAVRDMTRYAN